MEKLYETKLSQMEQRLRTLDEEAREGKYAYSKRAADCFRKQVFELREKVVAHERMTKKEEAQMMKETKAKSKRAKLLRKARLKKMRCL